MDTSTLQKQIDSGELLPLYAFWGEEEYLKQHYLDEICKLAAGGMEEFNLHVFDADGFSADRFADALEAYPMMGGRKVLVLRGIDCSKLKPAALDTLVAALGSIPPYACVVAHYGASIYSKQEPKRGKAVVTLAEKGGGSLEFKYPAESQLQKWAARHFKARGCDASADAVRRLVSITDGSMTALVGEIDKLAAYAAGRTLTAADVDALVVPSLESRVFDITDAIVAGEYARAVALINEQRVQREEPLRVLGLISGAMSEFLQVKCAAQAGIADAKTIAADVGISPRREFLVKRYMSLARRVEADYLKQCVLLCERAEADIKRSRMDEWQILEAAVMAMKAAC